MSEVEIWLEVLRREYKLTNYIMLGHFLGIAPSAITRWTQSKNDKALKLLQKHLIKNEVNLNEFEIKVEEFKKTQLAPTESPWIYRDKFQDQKPQTMADVKRHLQDQTRTKQLHDNVQKVLEFEATQSPTTSTYSELFQILMGENKDAIFQILSDKLEVENVDDVEKMKFIEDFEALIKHVVSPTAKLKMLERLKGKYK